MLTHVVLMTFADPADASEAKERLEALTGRIAALRSLHVALDRLGLPGSAHLALTTTHDDENGLRAYADDPAHQELLAWLRPRLTGRVVVDY